MRAGGQTEGKLERHSGLPAEVSPLVGRRPQIAAVLEAVNPMAAVVQALADRELLIVLDNCEHVLGSAGQVVATLAGQCRRVRVLATSRERLDVPANPSSRSRRWSCRKTVRSARWRGPRPAACSWPGPARRAPRSPRCAPG